MANTKKQPQTIETLQARYESLKEQRLVVEVQRKSTLEKLTELKQEALEKYGSDDLGELKTILARMKSENESKRAKYQQALDAIEKKLEAINEQFEESELANS